MTMTLLRYRPTAVVYARQESVTSTSVCESSLMVTSQLVLRMSDNAILKGGRIKTVVFLGVGKTLSVYPRHQSVCQFFGNRVNTTFIAKGQSYVIQK